MAYQAVYWISFFDLLAVSLIIPVLNLHIYSLGGSNIVIGCFGSLNAGLQFLGGPIAGSLSDTRGRKPILISSLMLILSSHVLLGMSSSLLILLVSRFMYGISNHGQTLLKAEISATVPSENLPKMLNKLVALAGLSYVVGPAIAGNLYKLSGGFYHISFILITTTLINIGLSSAYLQSKKVEALVADEKKNTKFFGNSSAIAKAFSGIKEVNFKKYGDILLLKFLGETAFMLLFGSFALICISRFPLSTDIFGYLLTFISALMILATLVMSHIKERFYHQDKTGFQRALHSLLILLVSVLGMAFATNYWIYIILLVPMSFSKPLIDTTWMEVLSSKSTKNEKGVVMGASESVAALAKFISPLLVGITADYSGVFAVCVLPIVPIVISIVLINKVNGSSPEKDK